MLEILQKCMNKLVIFSVNKHRREIEKQVKRLLHRLKMKQDNFEINLKPEIEILEDILTQIEVKDE